MTEDLTPFFDDFGIAATVAGSSVSAIFDNVFAQALGFTAGAAPTLICRAADVSSATTGTAVVVNSVSYTVTSAEPDGTGMTLLRLQEV